ncbi:MAG: DUF1207 domain-containing protein [Thermodesulfobacteriota bacterium]
MAVPSSSKMHPGFLLGLFAVLVLMATPLAGHAVSDNHSDGNKDVVLFPVRDVFAPIVADPKQPRFFASLQRFDNNFQGAFTGASVGYGETFGFLRKNLGPQHAWQFSVRGGLFSQFNMDTSSNNLLNSDYTIGFLWTYRYRHAAMRLRAYHQSSHIGDEFIEANPAVASRSTGFDYEAVDWLGALHWRGFRVYGGPHLLLKREPADLDRWGYQGGLEYNGTKEIVPYGSFLFGLDVKGFQQLSWTPAYSVKAGLNFKDLGRPDRNIKVLAEFYDGFVPFGQFYDYEMTSYGIGFYFGF